MLRFAVIGHPVAHSLSPRIHAANFRALGMDAAYDAVDVAPEDLAARLRRFAADGLRGINVTVPHKVAVKELVDRVDSQSSSRLTVPQPASTPTWPDSSIRSSP